MHNPWAETLAFYFLFCQIERTRTTTTSIIIIKGLKTRFLWRQIEVTQLEIKCDSAEQLHNQMGTICGGYPGISLFSIERYAGLMWQRQQISSCLAFKVVVILRIIFRDII